MPQLDLDGANSKISADTIRGQSGTTVTVQSGHNLVGSGSGLTALPAANITGTLPAIDGSNLTGISTAFRTGFHAWKNAGQSLAHDTATHITYTEEHYDPNGDYNASTSTFTAPEAGKYLIMGRVRFSSGVHEYMCRIMVYVNDAKVVEWDETSGNGTGMNVGMSTIRQLSANDTVKLYGTFYYAGWSSTMTFEADSNGYKYNDFAVQRVA